MEAVSPPLGQDIVLTALRIKFQVILQSKDKPELVVSIMMTEKLEKRSPFSIYFHPGFSLVANKQAANINTNTNSSVITYIHH